MSFFNLKEAIEEYILEHTLQEQIAPEEFEYQVYLDDNNQLIVKMFYHVNNYNPQEEVLLEYDKSMILMKCSDTVAQAHFADDTLNIFLEDTLLPNLPRNSNHTDSWTILIHPEYVIGNDTKFPSQVSRSRNTMSSLAITGSKLCPEIIHSATNGIDARHLTWKTSKTRSTVPNDNQRIYWNPEWEGLSGIADEQLQAMITVLNEPKDIYYQSSLARVALPGIDSHVITIDSIPQP